MCYLLPHATPILRFHDIELFAANIRTVTENILVQMHLTLVEAATSADNTFDAGSSSETYFAVKCMKAYTVS